ncbi:hypothetical protein [Priestia endophytica]|uniref:hypothetical protein n=1 Tax=Priestia endophytica TaxID=135735 RepID=UPI0022805D7B|nr:hypothetical protein [Priestia endophytica]MCY8233691.1 hypothetical protein [Priestia endophytica]
MGKLIINKQWRSFIFVNDGGEMTSRLCTKCKQLKSVNCFGKNKAGFAGKRPDCLSCMSKYKAEGYKKDNYDKQSIIYHRYRAKKHGLASTMTVELKRKALAEQGERCMLSHSEEIVVEHFIPLSWGTGLGDDYRNVVYMEKGLNASKGNKNPFIWIKSQPHDIQRRFYNELVPLLAERNGMTAKEYENFVNKCYEEYINNN